jgi:hypothetical protein
LINPLTEDKRAEAASWMKEIHGAPKLGEKRMADKIKTGTILIGDGAFLPESLQFESEPYSKDWRLVENLDSRALD